MTKAGKLTRLYTIIMVGTFFCIFLYWFIVWKDKAYTDDAYVQGNLVTLTPLQSGFVKGIFKDDTFLAKKGELLVTLDETDAKIALESAKKNLALTVRKVCQNFHEVFALKADIESKKAEYIKAAQDYEHRAYVIEAGAVSVEDYEHAIAALRSSFFQLQMTEVLFEKALSLVQNTTLLNHPEIISVSDTLRQAFVNLERCNIYAPVEGLIAQRNIQVGMWVPSGYPLLAIIPLDEIWVNANFKETQMKKMRIGQKVHVTSDLYGEDIAYKGTIVGLPGGAGNAFSILPPQNLSGNWIKIVQRLPVRVALDKKELEIFPLRIGLSMRATADLKEPGLLVPDSFEGSPSYTTDIFVNEEQGDPFLIRKIILDNLDPSLAQFIETPLCF
jgi:membrane fusion protein, multidrug efflux system